MLDSMFRKLHRKPKVKGSLFRKNYYYKQSLERYLRTEDGKYFSSLRLLTGEIGRIDSVRFITVGE